LNLAWLTVATLAAAGVLSRRRDARVFGAIVCALALLVPIISLSDDLSADNTLEEALAVLVVVSAVVILIAIGRLSSAPVVLQSLHRTVLCDPRSPPRG
jgi:hypothetical protein